MAAPNYCRISPEEFPAVFTPSLSHFSEEINSEDRSLPFVCLKTRFSWVSQVRLGKGGKRGEKDGRKGEAAAIAGQEGFGGGGCRV